MRHASQLVGNDPATDGLVLAADTGWQYMLHQISVVNRDNAEVFVGFYAAAAGSVVAGTGRIGPIVCAPALTAPGEQIVCPLDFPVTQLVVLASSASDGTGASPSPTPHVIVSYEKIRA